MTQYNPNDFYPKSGQEINSSGNTVNPADSVDSSGNQGTVINKRKQTTIQTQNNVTVAANGASVSSFISCDGFDKVATTMTCDAATASTLQLVWSNDGVNNHYYETISTVAATSKGGITDVKATWVKLNLVNGDAGASHVMNAWLFLKA